MSDKENQEEHQASTTKTTSKYEYETVESIIKKFDSGAPNALDKINIYAVITFIKPPKVSANSKHCTTFTLVDNTCSYGMKLHCVAFSDEITNIEKHCEVGDIIRFHRFKVQNFKNLPQGVATGICSWIRFKLNDSNFSFEGNNTASSVTFEEYDKVRVKELRDWVKSDPDVLALRELNLFPKKQNTNLDDTTSPTDSQLIEAANAMNMQLTSNTGTIQNLTNTSFPSANPIKITQINQDCFFDIVLQVCAICDCKGTKFVLVWDGSKSNFVVHQENDFTFYSTLASTATAAANSVYENKVFFSKNNQDYLCQFYIYDEFESQLDNLEAGDYVLLRNARSIKPKNSIADMILKLPGAMSTNNKFGRCLKKLISFNDIDTSLSAKIPAQFLAIIKSIHQKGKELKFDFFTETEFSAEFFKLKNNTMDETFNEVVKKINTNPQENHSTANNLVPTVSLPKETIVQNGKSPGITKKTVVDRMLEDEEDMYTDDESSDENFSEATQKPNKLFDKENFQNSPCTKLITSLSKRTTSPGETIKNYLGEITKPNEVISSTSNNPNILNTLADFQVQPTETQRIKDSVRKCNELALEFNRSDSQSNRVFINGIYPSSKRTKKIDNIEISSDIYKLKKLTSLTYLVPYLTSSTLDDAKKFIKSVPCFNSLQYLAEEAEKHNFLKCKVIAKIFGYSIKTCPHIGSVFVTCKKCNYVNFTPFHAASIHQEATLNDIMNDSGKQQVEADSTESNENDISRSDETLAKQSINFSLDWLQTAQPTAINDRMLNTQYTQGVSATQVKFDKEPKALMDYECPRCSLNESDMSIEEPSEELQSSFSSLPLLEYIYRFWFVLRDASSTLEPCLLEADMAERFLNHIPPGKFYTKSTSANQVYKLIYEQINRKFLFTIETYKLNGDTTKSSEGDIKKPLKFLYKIVDAEELIRT